MLVFALTLLAWQVRPGAAVRQTSTHGDSGPLCGSHRCLLTDNAQCVQGECKCPDDGIGHFVCVKPGQQFCAIFNDPIVRSFDNSHTKAPIPLKVLVAHLKTKTCVTSNPDNASLTSGTCDFRYYAWGGRKLGKTFLRGIYVNILITSHGRSYHHATRIHTQAFDGEYIYSEGGNTIPFGGRQFTDPVTTNIPGLGPIHTVYDTGDNFARVIARPCGIEVGIRGVERVLNPLLVPAGVYIKVLETCDPHYLSNTIALCSPPRGKGQSLKEQAQALSSELGRPVSPQMVALLKTLTSEIIQDFPDAPAHAQMLLETASECDRSSLVDALLHCQFILHNSLFLNCYDKGDDGDKAIQLYNECLFSLCDENQFLCNEIKKFIMESKCNGTLAAEKQTILDFSCTF